eukprot:72573_1
MDTLILFHQTLDAFTDDEFFAQCIPSFGRDCITMLIFKGLMQEVNENKAHNVKKLNKIISDIHQRRNTDSNDNNDIDLENDTEEHQPIQLDHLPYLMLHHVSSFLSFADGLQFEKANRSIFIGSRSSTSPTHALDSTHFDKLIEHCNTDHHSCLPTLRLFESISIHAADICEWNEEEDCFDALSPYPWGELKLFHHIRDLTIEMSEVDWWGKIAMFHNYISSKQLQHITTLRLQSQEHPDGVAADLRNLLHMVTNCPTIEYLEISARFYHKNDICYNNEAIGNLISQLKGIALNSMRFDQSNDVSASDYIRFTHLYPFLSDNLQSFHKTLPLFSNARDGIFKGLKELCLPWLLCKQDIDILNRQNISNIERIFFNDVDAAKELVEWGIVNDVDEYKHDIWCTRGMGLFIQKIMDSLEYVGIDLNQNKSVVIASNIIHILSNCFKNRSHKKDKLKIRINDLKLKTMDDWISISAKLKCLIDILDSKCFHFMFICCGLQLNEPQPTWNWDFIRSFKQKYIVMQNRDANGYNFVISNKGCNMNGYQEKWIMSCTNCQQNNVF